MLVKVSAKGVARVNGRLVSGRYPGAPFNQVVLPVESRSGKIVESIIISTNSLVLADFLVIYIFTLFLGLLAGNLLAR